MGICEAMAQERHDEKERKRNIIRPLFEKAVKALGMVRTGLGNNDLHENAHLSMFIASFPEPHVMVCDKGCSVVLHSFQDEETMQATIKWAKERIYNLTRHY
jgi:hypothetical protein